VRSRAEVDKVLEYVRAGWNDCEIARETGIPRRTILDWRSGRTPDFDRVRTRPGWGSRSCAVCNGDPLRLPQAAFTYLLGLYLGDGCISTHPRGVFRLGIVCADAYPELIRLCHAAMAEGSPTR
jgi:Homeodomain-like domain